MKCPICGSELYKTERTETTTGTFITIFLRCCDPTCGYFDYKTMIPLNISREITGVNN